jgi:hypothetical protein
MKPLDPETRRFLDETREADAPPADLEERVWRSLAPRLTEDLPPTAAVASRALGTQSVAIGLGVGAKLLMAALVLGMLFGSVRLYLALHAQPDVPPASPAASLVESPPPPAARVETPVAQVESTLLEETRLLTKAQAAFAAGNLSRALRFLEQHRARFPRGELAQERDAVEVLALCGLPRMAAARRAQQLFLRSWPDSPLAERVRAACRDR